MHVINCGHWLTRCIKIRSLRFTVTIMIFQAGHQLLIWNLRLLGIFQFKPLFYDTESKQFAYRSQSKFNVIVVSSTVVVLLINGIHTLTFSTGLTMSTKAFIVTFLVGWCTGYPIAFPILNGTKTVVDLLNLIGHFEHRYLEPLSKLINQQWNHDFWKLL